MTEKNLISRFFLGGALLAVLGFVVYAETNNVAGDSPVTESEQSSQLVLDEQGKDVNLPVYAPSSYWIGVRVAPIPEVLLSHFGVKDSNSGLVVVEQVVETSPASKANLKRGDVILKYGDKNIQTLDDLVQEIAVRKDSAQKLEVIRDGGKTELRITPESRPAESVILSGPSASQWFQQGMLPPGMLPRGMFRGRMPQQNNFPGNAQSETPDSVPGADPMLSPDLKLGREIWLGGRDPRQMMKEMEEYFRQMQGGNDADQLSDGSTKRLEVTSRTDKDGKVKIKVMQIYKVGDDTEEKTWEVEHIDELPEEIRGEVKSLVGR